MKELIVDYAIKKRKEAFQTETVRNLHRKSQTSEFFQFSLFF